MNAGTSKYLTLILALLVAQGSLYWLFLTTPVVLVGVFIGPWFLIGPSLILIPALGALISGWRGVLVGIVIVPSAFGIWHVYAKYKTEESNKNNRMEYSMQLDGQTAACLGEAGEFGLGLPERAQNVAVVINKGVKEGWRLSFSSMDFPEGVAYHENPVDPEAGPVPGQVRVTLRSIDKALESAQGRRVIGLETTVTTSTGLVAQRKSFACFDEDESVAIERFLRRTLKRDAVLRRGDLHESEAVATEYVTARIDTLPGSASIATNSKIRRMGMVSNFKSRPEDVFPAEWGCAFTDRQFRDPPFVTCHDKQGSSVGMGRLRHAVAAMDAGSHWIFVHKLYSRRQEQSPDDYIIIEKLSHDGRLLQRVFASLGQIKSKEMGAPYMLPPIDIRAFPDRVVLYWSFPKDPNFWVISIPVKGFGAKAN